jgi:hypothetical protein
MTPSTSTAGALRNRLSDRLAMRRTRLMVERELSNYDSPTGRQELEAILARHEPTETAGIVRVPRRRSRGHLAHAGR